LIERYNHTALFKRACLELVPINEGSGANKGKHALVLLVTYIVLKLTSARLGELNA
jgi:hypothetical protein